MRKNLFIVTLVGFVNALSVAVVVPIIYSYGKQFGLDDVGASLLLALFALSQLIATPVIGKFSDRYGRKRLLVVCLAGTALANLVAANAASVGVLFLARIVDGITGGNNSVAQAVISDTTAPADRAKSFAGFAAAYSLAFVIGPVVSLFAQNISLQAPFYVAAAAAMLAAGITAVFLPETLSAKSRYETLSLRTLGLVQIFSSLKLPLIGNIMLLQFLATLAYGILSFGFQPFVINKFEFTTQWISLVLMTYGLIRVLMQMFVVRKLVARVELTTLLRAGLIVGSVSLFVFSVVESVAIFWGITIVFAAASALNRPIISALVSINAKAEDQGVALGVMDSYLSLSNTVGPIVGGTLIGIWLGLPFFVAGVINGFALIVLVVLQRNMRAKPVLADTEKPDL